METLKSPPDRGSEGPSEKGNKYAHVLLGVAVGIAGLLIGEAIAGLLGLDNGPILAVATAVIEITPGPIALFLIDAVGKLDKPLLIIGTVVIFLSLSALAGVWAKDRRPRAIGVFVVLATIGAAALVFANKSTPAALVVALAGLVTWLGLLHWLSQEAHDLTNRRRFLGLASAAVVGPAIGAFLVRQWSNARREVEAVRGLLKLPLKSPTKPGGADLGVAGLEPWATPNEDFYQIGTTLTPPAIAPANWSLRIHGMVEREVVVTYDELIKEPMTHAWITLACVSNDVGGDLIGNAYWTGVPIRKFLERAGVKSGADAVRQTSHDGWDCGTPIEALTDDRNALLAIGMNGEPLPLDHGFPVRMVVPGLYGFVSATKWVVDLEVTRFADFEAYWTQRGWSAKGPIKLQSRIDVPRQGATLKAGTTKIGGFAWSQHVGIQKVEYQLNGGPWQEAELGSVPGRDTWVQWAGEVEVSKGKQSVLVRATDAEGMTQTAVKRDKIPDGATGWHRRDFEVR